MSFNRVISALLANFHQRRFRSPFSNIKIISPDRNNIIYEHVREGKYTSLLGEITATVSMGCRELLRGKIVRCSSRSSRDRCPSIKVDPAHPVRHSHRIFFEASATAERDREIRYRHRHSVMSKRTAARVNTA